MSSSTAESEIATRRLTMTFDSRQLLNFKELKALIGLSRTTIWRLEKRGEFPAHVKLGARRIAWHRPAVYRWIDLRLAS